MTEEEAEPGVLETGGVLPAEEAVPPAAETAPGIRVHREAVPDAPVIIPVLPEAVIRTVVPETADLHEVIMLTKSLKAWRMAILTKGFQGGGIPRKMKEAIYGGCKRVDCEI